MGARHRLHAAWLGQRGHLFGWVPVCLGIGVALYFGRATEPAGVAYLWVGGGVLCAVLAAVRLPYGVSPVFWGAALVGIGFCVAGGRAHQVAEPVLSWRYYGPVEGRIVAMDRSASDALRLTLDRVRLDRMSPARLPARVRLSLHGRQGFVSLAPGQHVMTTAHLSPPSGPVEPGGFDFQRHAFFLGLGAVGYTRTPVLTRAPPDGSQRVFAARLWVSARVQAALPGQTGAFAAAIMTGDRAALDQGAIEALRVTNLAHLLAISGLHMGLLAGFVFGALRIGFAAVPALGLRLPAKKIAAGGALAAAAGYLVLSGAAVATERAFVMAAVVLIAVMLDRRALSLRAVAIAAMIVLVLRPEALLGPGFQMSFAATTALVAVYGWMRDRDVPLGPRWSRVFTTVLLSSFVAGLATAPIAAAHFNQFAHYGLVANLLSVPLMGLLVMPAAVVAALALPLGLEMLPLRLMGLGIDWILGVAHWVAALPGARGTVVAPGPAILPLLAMGALFIVLWQGRGRAAGVPVMALALLLWTQSERPDVLISRDGGLVGVMTGAGRALSRERGSGFEARIWLENDGDKAVQAVAARRWPAAAGDGAAPAVTALRGKRAAAALEGCGNADIIVLNVDPPPGIAAGLACALWHPARLRATGAVALYRGPDGMREVTARARTGARLWNTDARASDQ